jgi:hypothetical protein
VFLKKIIEIFLTTLFERSIKKWFNALKKELTPIIRQSILYNLLKTYQNHKPNHIERQKNQLIYLVKLFSRCFNTVP